MIWHSHLVHKGVQHGRHHIRQVLLRRSVSFNNPADSLRLNETAGRHPPYPRRHALLWQFSKACAAAPGCGLRVPLQQQPTPGGPLS